MLPLSLRLHDFFESAIRSRGRAYMSEGRVSSPETQGSLIQLQVEGSETYEVSFVIGSPDPSSVTVSCQCASFAGGAFCKHLWASILKLEMSGFSPKFGQIENLKLRHANFKGRARVDSDLEDEASAIATGPQLLVYVINLVETRAKRELIIDLWNASASHEDPLEHLERFAPRRMHTFAQPKDSDLLALYQRATRIGTGIPAGLHEELLEGMASSGRLLLAQTSDEIADPKRATPLKWNAQTPWGFRLEISSRKNSYVLSGTFHRKSRSLGVEEPALVLDSGLMVIEGEIHRMSPTRSIPWVLDLRRNKAIRVPQSEGDTLVERVLSDPRAPLESWPAELRWKKESAPPKPLAQLKSPSYQHALGTTVLSIDFDYGGIKASANYENPYALDPFRKVCYVRDHALEQREVSDLCDLLGISAQFPDDEPPQLLINWTQLSEATPEMIDRGWSITAYGKPLRRPGKFETIVSSGIDWFDVSGKVMFDEASATLPELLAAQDRGQSWITLSDGSVGLLPTEWLEKFKQIAAVGEARTQSIRLKKSQGLLLDAWAEHETSLRADPEFAKYREKVRSFQGIQTMEAPPGFKGKLRRYQKEGLAWMHFLKEFECGGILADDMGLGKTIQLLSFLKSIKASAPSIVVAPKGLVYNWIEEAARFTPELKVIGFIGPKRDAMFKDFSRADLIVTSYPTLRSDIEKLRLMEFECAVIDEAQFIKNPGSLVARSCKALRAKHRFAMTGTPIENSLGDLFSILEFASPNLISKNAQTRLTAEPSSGSGSRLGQALRPFILRRTKEKVLKELPPKTVQTLYCDLSPREMKLYAELRDHYRKKIGRQIDEDGIARAKFHILEALLRLRQAAIHPGLVDKTRVGETSAKTEALLEHLTEVIEEGHKALVFSQFTGMLSIVRKQLDAAGIRYEYLDGKTRDREAPVKTFQNDPDCRVFLISLKAGGTGLNLTAADYVFLLDPWWNPAAEAQAIDRTHRIGQTKKVFAYRMIAKGTVEEKILELQKNKKILAESILTDDAGFLKKLTREDLELLLS